MRSKCFCQRDESVVVPSRKIAHVERDVSEPRDLHRFALREEAIGDPALIENLDSAGVQAARARADELLRCARRSTIATSTRANVNSPANIIPVGPPSGNHHRMFSSSPSSDWYRACRSSHS